MSDPVYYPKGWRAGPTKLPRKVFSAEDGGTYVSPRPAPRATAPAPSPAPAPAPAPAP